MTTTVKKARSVKKVRKPRLATIQVRLDAKTKGKVAKFFKKRGVSTSGGVRILLDQAMEDDYLPHVPNAETIKAIEEGMAEKGEPVTREELWKMWEEV